METNNGNGQSEENNAAVKWFNETSAAMSKLFNKQMDLAAVFNRNFFNLALRTNESIHDSGSFARMFPDNTFTKWFNPNDIHAGQIFSNPFVNSAGKIYKQILELNRDLMATFNQHATVNENGWKPVKDYTAALQSGIESIKTMTGNLAAMYNKHWNTSIENNKQMQAKIHEQLNAFLKESQKFWTDTYSAAQAKDENGIVNDQRNAKTEKKVAELQVL